MINLSIIIPTFNRDKIFGDCIESALSSISSNDEILVINDSKTSIPQIPTHPQLHLYNNPKSGVASARNYGASLSKGKYLLFIDDDMIIHRQSITDAIEYLSLQPNSVYNTNWTYSSDTMEYLKAYQFGRFLLHIHYESLEGWCNFPKDWNLKKHIPYPCITSQFLAMEKTTFQTVGGYNETFPYAGYEDLDLAEKIKSKGFNITINTQTTIIHNEIDRLDLIPWLDRKYRGGITQKVAAEMGYNSAKRKDSFFKKVVFNCIYKLRKFIYIGLKLIPNKVNFDYLYFYIISILVGANLSYGYHLKKIKN